MRVVSSATYIPTSVFRNFKTTVLASIQSVTTASTAALAAATAPNHHNNNNHRLSIRGIRNRNRRSSSHKKVEHHSSRQRRSGKSLRDNNDDEDGDTLETEAIFADKHYCRYNFSNIEENRDQTSEGSSGDESSENEETRHTIVPSVSSMLHAIGSSDVFADCSPGEPFVFADSIPKTKRSYEKDTVHLLSVGEDEDEDDESSDSLATATEDTTTLLSEFVDWRSDSHLIGNNSFRRKHNQQRRSDSPVDDECRENIPVELTLGGSKKKNRLLLNKNRKKEGPKNNNDPVTVFDAHIGNDSELNKDDHHPHIVDNRQSTTNTATATTTKSSSAVVVDRKPLSCITTDLASLSSNQHKDGDGSLISPKSSPSSTRSTPEWSLKTFEKLSKQSTYQQNHSPKRVVHRKEQKHPPTDSSVDFPLKPFDDCSSSLSNDNNDDTTNSHHTGNDDNPFFNPTYFQKEGLSIVVESNNDADAEVDIKDAKDADDDDEDETTRTASVAFF